MRTRNSIYNFIFEMLYSVLLIAINFIVRKVITNSFGIELIGLSDILNQIINVLSLAELGISSVIIFYLYKPLKDNDYDQINKIMQVFKKLYHQVSFFITIFGVLLIPFLQLFIRDYTLNFNYIVIYLLLLFQTSTSYLFTYKMLLMRANQKTYYYMRIMIVLKLIAFIAELFVLNIFRNYYLYLVFVVINSILINFIITLYVGKKYKYLNNKSEIVSLEEKNNIKKDIGNSFVSLVSGKVTESSDSIIIAVLGNVTILGYYSNYYLILTAINRIISKLFIAMQASLGNKAIDDNNDNIYDVYQKLNFLSFFLALFCSVTYYLIVNSIITMWLGDVYILNDLIVILLSIQVFIMIYRRPLWNYMSILGLFKKDKIAAITGCLLNIILSIILYFSMGIAGVILATLISQIVQYIIKTHFLLQRLNINRSVDIKNNLIKSSIFVISLIIMILLKEWTSVYISIIIIYILLIIYICIFFGNEFKYFYDKIVNLNNRK